MLKERNNKKKENKGKNINRKLRKYGNRMKLKD